MPDNNPAVEKDAQFGDAARAIAEIFKFVAGLGGGGTPSANMYPLGGNELKSPFNAVAQSQVRVPPGIGSAFLNQG